MNKTKYLFVGLTGLFFILAITILLMFGRTEKADSLENEVVQVQDYDYIYIMKEYNGKIGIFLPSDSTPNEIIDVDISLLPEDDQAELMQGIEVKDEATLKKLIEDFDG